MKKITLNMRAVIMVGIIAAAANPILGQNVVPATTTSTTTTSEAAPAPATTTTTAVTSTGTVSEFTPNDIELKVSDQPAPVRYTFTKTTSYVDESGNPVSVETVRAGAPVVVYYEKSGDQFVASKVVVRKSVTSSTSVDPNPIQPLAAAPAPVAAAPQTAVPPKVDGIIKDADSDDIAITTATSPEKMVYKAHDGTAYVDESGNPVSRHMLKKGTPVTIFYERDGDDMSATRVVVKSMGSDSGSIPVQQSSTTTQETQTTHIAQ